MTPVRIEPTAGIHFGGIVGAVCLAMTLAGCTLLATGQLPGTAYWWPTVSAPDTAEEARPVRQVIPAQATVLQAPVDAVDFIVKLKSADALDEALSLCRRDLEAANARFAQWASGDPVFAGMTIVGCSYSGEFILRQSLQPAAASGEAQIDAMLERIRGHENVAYADPDFTARIGLQE